MNQFKRVICLLLLGTITQCFCTQPEKTPTQQIAEGLTNIKTIKKQLETSVDQLNTNLKNLKKQPQTPESKAQFSALKKEIANKERILKQELDTRKNTLKNLQKKIKAGNALTAQEVNALKSALEAISYWHGSQTAPSPLLQSGLALPTTQTDLENIRTEYGKKGSEPGQESPLEQALNIMDIPLTQAPKLEDKQPDLSVQYEHLMESLRCANYYATLAFSHTMYPNGYQTYTEWRTLLADTLTFVYLLKMSLGNKDIATVQQSLLSLQKEAGTLAERLTVFSNKTLDTNAITKIYTDMQITPERVQVVVTSISDAFGTFKNQLGNIITGGAAPAAIAAETTGTDTTPQEAPKAQPTKPQLIFFTSAQNSLEKTAVERRQAARKKTTEPTWNPPMLAYAQPEELGGNVQFQKDRIAVEKIIAKHIKQIHQQHRDIFAQDTQCANTFQSADSFIYKFFNTKAAKHSAVAELFSSKAMPANATRDRLLVIIKAILILRQDALYWRNKPLFLSYRIECAKLLYDLDQKSDKPNDKTFAINSKYFSFLTDELFDNTQFFAAPEKTPVETANLFCLAESQLLATRQEALNKISAITASAVEEAKTIYEQLDIYQKAITDLAKQIKSKKQLDVKIGFDGDAWKTGATKSDVLRYYARSVEFGIFSKFKLQESKEKYQRPAWDLAAIAQAMNSFDKEVIEQVKANPGLWHSWFFDSKRCIDYLLKRALYLDKEIYARKERKTKLTPYQALSAVSIVGEHRNAIYKIQKNFPSPTSMIMRTYALAFAQQSTALYISMVFNALKSQPDTQNKQLYPMIQQFLAIQLHEAVQTAIKFQKQAHQLALIGAKEIPTTSAELQAKSNLLINEFNNLEQQVITTPASVIFSLYRQGTRLNENGHTVLHEAVQNNASNKIIELITKQPTLISISEIDGWTPVHLAAARGNKEAFLALVNTEQGKQLLTVPENDGLNPIHLLAWTKRDETLAELNKQPLEGYSAALLRRDVQGRIPLHLAVMVNKEIEGEEKEPGETAEAYRPAESKETLVKNTIETLLNTSRGKETIALKDDVGGTPLHYAVIERPPSIVKILISSDQGKEAIIAQNITGQTPLHLAASRSKEKNDAGELITNQLLATDAGKVAAEIEDKQGNPPYIYATNNTQLSSRLHQSGGTGTGSVAFSTGRSRDTAVSGGGYADLFE